MHAAGCMSTHSCKHELYCACICCCGQCKLQWSVVPTLLDNLDFVRVCSRLVEVEYAEIEDRKVRSQLQNVGAIERQVSRSVQ